MGDVDINQLVELKKVKELEKGPDPGLFDMNGRIARGHNINEMITVNPAQ